MVHTHTNSHNLKNQKALALNEIIKAVTHRELKSICMCVCEWLGFGSPGGYKRMDFSVE